MNDSTAYTLHKLTVEIDRIADKLLQQQVGLTYGQFYYLFTLNHNAKATQHALAQALGYSDPAVSTMTSTLTAKRYITVTTDPQHRRRRLLALTPTGRSVLTQSLSLLDDCFSDIAQRAGVSESAFGHVARQLLDAAIIKNKEV